MCSAAGTRIIYDRKFLLDQRNSPLAQTPPAHLPVIPGVTSQNVLRENKKNEANNHINNHDGKPAKGSAYCMEVFYMLLTVTSSQCPKPTLVLLCCRWGCSVWNGHLADCSHTSRSKWPGITRASGLACRNQCCEPSWQPSSLALCPAAGCTVCVCEWTIGIQCTIHTATVWPALEARG